MAVENMTARKHTCNSILNGTEIFYYGINSSMAVSYLEYFF